MAVAPVYAQFTTFASSLVFISIVTSLLPKPIKKSNAPPPATLLEINLWSLTESGSRYIQVEIANPSQAFHDENEIYSLAESSFT